MPDVATSAIMPQIMRRIIGPANVTPPNFAEIAPRAPRQTSATSTISGIIQRCGEASTISNGTAAPAVSLVLKQRPPAGGETAERPSFPVHLGPKRYGRTVSPQSVHGSSHKLELGVLLGVFFATYQYKTFVFQLFNIPRWIPPPLPNKGFRFSSVRGGQTFYPSASLPLEGGQDSPTRSASS